MRTVHKYRILVTEQQAVEMPEGAQMLSVLCTFVSDEMHELYLYALVDTAMPLTTRTLFTFGTGQAQGHA
jgi:hypothetical protein